MAMLSERLPQLLPMAAVSAVCSAWALAPSVPVKVEGSALLLAPESRVGVYARSAGQVQELVRRIGDRVKQGDLLMSINRLDQQAGGAGNIGPANDALLDQIQAVKRQRQTIESRIGTLRTANQPVGLQLKALENLRRDDVIPRYSPLWVGAQDLYLRNESAIQELTGPARSTRGHPGRPSGPAQQPVGAGPARRHAAGVERGSRAGGDPWPTARLGWRWPQAERWRSGAHGHCPVR